MRVNVGEYYEGKLQIRPYDSKVVEFVKNLVSKRKNVSIVKEVELKEGVDLYLTSNKFLMIIGRKLKKSFKGTIKISRKLYSVNKLTSKKIYRITVCFRLKKDL